MRRRSLLVQTLVTGAAVLLVAATATLLLIRSIDQERDGTALAGRAEKIVASGSALERFVVDMETGLRGYLITGDERFLQPTNEALQLYPGTVEGLGRMLGAGPDHRRLDRISADIDAYVADYLKPQIVLGRRDLPAARGMINSRAGKQRVDELRRQFGELVAAQSHLADAATERSQRAARRARITAIVGLSLAALLVVGSIALEIGTVMLPVRRLAAAAQRIEAGDLSARVPVGNVRQAEELKRMSRAFNRMGDSVQAANDERVELQRAKDDFFALISHELRTPLTAIVGYAELLLEDQSLPPEQQHKFIDVINRNSRRLLRLVGDMLFIARMEAGGLDFERIGFDLSQVVRESVETFGPRAERGRVELRAEIAELGSRTGDPGRMGQAIDNLISNAIKFTPRGGRVTVRAVRGEGGEPIIEVSDTGRGISEEDQQRLFDRFFRAASAKRDAVEGTGLGLSIVKAIVDGHDGEVSVRSAMHEGTTFRITLPA
ncbi:MAG: hypothetical protein QOG09_53 [Solirubrobacterales bacterium]|nr:hypothetical protein [Solirubrobacterales bacterium]